MPVAFVECRIDRNDVPRLSGCVACGEPRSTSCEAIVRRDADLRPLWHPPPLFPCCSRCARLQQSVSAAGPMVVTALVPAAVGLASLLALPLDAALQPVAFIGGVMLATIAAVMQRRSAARRAAVVLLGGEEDSLRLQLRIPVAAEAASSVAPPYRASAGLRELVRELPLPARLRDARAIALLFGVILGGLLTLVIAGQAYPVVRVGNAGTSVLRYRTRGGFTHELSVGATETTRLRWGESTLHTERAGARSNLVVPIGWGAAIAVAIDDIEACHARLVDARLLELQRSLSRAKGLGEPGVTCLPLSIQR